MRKIEQKMVNAVTQRYSWSEGNTTVNIEEQANKVTVFLYGNRIAYQYKPNECFLSVDENTLNKFPTRTTFSRLRALGFTLTKGQHTNRWTADAIRFGGKNYVN